MTPTIKLIDAPDPRAKAAAGEALYAYNVAQIGIDDRRPIGCEATDPATEEVVGGLWGRTEMGLLFLDMFFLSENLRGSGSGSQLLEEVETEARRRGCRRAVVETSSFQAPGFYMSHGYQEFGRVPFAVANHARIFLGKELA